MKKLLFFVLAVITLAACKDDDPEPDAGTRVAGTYELSRLILDETGTEDDLDLPTLPVSSNGLTASGDLVATRVNENTVSVLVTVRGIGPQDIEFVPIEFSLTQNGNGYDLVADGERYGTTDGIDFNIDVGVTDNRLTVVGRRR